MDSTIVSSVSALEAFLDGLPPTHEKQPCLFVDLEGNNLSREGSLSLITILFEHQSTVHLIDITTMGKDAFTAATSTGRTLKGILESKDIIKVFFDIRNDSDALFALYGVHMRGVEDLQLMELASRSFSKKFVNGLAKCIARDAKVGYREKQKWQKVKDNGHKLFDPALGGTYSVFDERPLTPEMTAYCVQDVALMPQLRDIYRAKLCDAWWAKIVDETEKRIQLSQ